MCRYARLHLVASLALPLIVAASEAPAQSAAPPAAGQQSELKSASASPSADATNVLKNVLTSMGLKLETVKDHTINVQSKGNIYEFVVSDDGSVIFINVWWSIPQDKISRIPMAEMLAWNSEHYSYFGIERHVDGSAVATMSVSFTAKGIDAALVRDRLDTIEQDSDKETSLFDTANWK